MGNTPYATVEEFRLMSDSIGTEWDIAIQMCLDAAGETIDGFCNQGVPFFSEAAEARSYAGSGQDVQWIDKCTAVTLVEVKASPSDSTWTSLNAADWVLFSGDAKKPNFNKKPFTGLLLTGAGQGAFPSSVLPTVRVTARWGLADDVPAGVKQATIAQAYRWFKRGQGSWGDTIANVEMGLVSFRKALDPDIQMMLINARLVKPALG